jgi:hypothetical protein
MESTNILSQVMSPDNQTRNRAEEFLKNERETNPANLLAILLSGMKPDSEPATAQLAALLYKKMFLDDARSESLAATDLEYMLT